MFCPNCGNEMDDKYIYCSKCGSELQLVPEFELDEDILKEVEEAANELNKEPLNDLFEDVDFFENRKNITRRAEPVQKSVANNNKNKKIDKNKILLAQIAGLSALIIVAVISVVIFFSSQSKKNSDEYQVKKAQEYLKEKDYKNALEHFKKAYSINSKNLEVVKGIALCYYETGDKESAILYYLEAAEEDPKDEDVFDTLLSIYVDMENQEGIRELYNLAQTQSIRDKFSIYLTAEPVFSLEEGTYKELTEVSISLAEKGEIYYTLDGTTPTEESTKYKEPISLKEGKTVIHAIAVTKSGQVSDEVVKTYEIALETPKAPGITPDSGRYTEATRVEIAVEEGSKVYYTLDGSAPTEDSASCKSSFPMPLGNNIISVMYVDKNGKTSEITKKNYNLSVDFEVSADDALLAVKNTMLQRGEIENMEGYVTGGDGLFTFNTFCVDTILGEQYYIIEKHKEYFNGGKKFICYYAYNISTGKIYNAAMDENDTFKLSAL